MTRTIPAVFVAAVLVAGAANAQMKKGAATPPPLTPNSPVMITTGGETPIDAAKRIERDDAIKMVKSKKAVWVDVRPADIYNEGHIAGAINIPLSDLLRRLKDLPPNKYYITYCA